MKRLKPKFSGKRIPIVVFFWLFGVQLPCKAFSVSYGASDFEKFNAYDAPQNSGINTSLEPDGFKESASSSGFFVDNSEFLLLGVAESDSTDTDSTISTDSFRYLASQALSPVFTLTTEDTQKNLLVEFDWAFQGNSEGDTSSLDRDVFGVAFSVSGDPSNEAAQLLLRDTSTTEGYESQKDYSKVIESGILQSGTDYRMVINLTEGADVGTSPQCPLTSCPEYGRSSAVGIDNVTISTIEEVPFNFTSSQGLLILMGFSGFNYLFKKSKLLNKRSEGKAAK